MPNQNNQECTCKVSIYFENHNMNCPLYKKGNNQDWKEKLWIIARGMTTLKKNELADFIEQTIHQETAKAVEKRVRQILTELALMHTTEGFGHFTREYRDTDRYRDLIFKLPSLQPTNNTKETK